MTELEQLKKENAELKAHVERLRLISDAAKHYIVDDMRGCGREDKTIAINLVSALEAAFFAAPAQSLREIRRDAMEKAQDEILSHVRAYMTEQLFGVRQVNAVYDAIRKISLPLEDE